MPAIQLLPQNGGPRRSTARGLRTKIADGVSFARCMRHRAGVANFPDPTPQGQLTVAMVQAQGIDIHSPAVLRAVQECLPASHGMLTPAKVAEAPAVGLRSVSSFTSSFTRTYGMPPGAYRAAFPAPAATHALIPACVLRAYSRPNKHRTSGEDTSPLPA